MTSSPNFGCSRVPRTLIGSTVPAPFFLKNGSTTFKSTERTPPPAASEMVACSAQRAVECEDFAAQAVGAVEVHGRPRNPELQRRQRQRAVCELELSLELGRDPFGRIAGIAAGPRAHPPELVLHLGIAELT